MANQISPGPQRSHARSNRARILEVARRELGDRPDATLDEIARAAGVVRRTLYGHFSSRAALLEALSEEASAAVREVVEAAEQPSSGPEEALARLQLALWQFGDRYRMLSSLARRDLGEAKVAEVLAPAVERSIEVLARGQEAGVFHRQLPAHVVAEALKGIAVELLEAVNSGAWQDDGTGFATATLIAAGVAPDRAAEVVHAVKEAD